jgi:hypothetical protein
VSEFFSLEASAPSLEKWLRTVPKPRNVRPEILFEKTRG